MSEFRNRPISRRGEGGWKRVLAFSQFSRKVRWFDGISADAGRAGMTPSTRADVSLLTPMIRQAREDRCIKVSGSTEEATRKLLARTSYYVAAFFGLVARRSGAVRDAPIQLLNQ